MRAVAWALVAGLLVIGWFFIVWQNKFHMTAPTVMLCLGYLAVIATVANLWRVGAAAVAPEDATADAWARPIGPHDELEKEKKTLLKAIKEAEFDLAMGKLSKVDAEQLITMYRTRAIAVIKELERLDGIAAAEDKRGQIEREVAARLALEGAASKKKDKAAKKAAKKAAGKPEKFMEPPKPGAANDDDDEETDVEKTNVEKTDVETTEVDKGGPPIRQSHPSQASFSTSNEGDNTPIPPPAPERASMMSFSTSNDGDHTPLPPPALDADGDTKLGPPIASEGGDTKVGSPPAPDGGGDTKVGVPPAPDSKGASS